jgi:hypothetical protein
MIYFRKLGFSALVVIVFLALVTGCGVQTTTMSNKPAEQFNPAMSEHQKALRTAKAQQANSSPNTSE